MVVQKTPLYTIPFTDKNGVNYPNSKEIPFGFQTARDNIPKITVFIPLLGYYIWHLSPNSQFVNRNYSIGANVDLLNLNGLMLYTETV